MWILVIIIVAFLLLRYNTIQHNKSHEEPAIGSVSKKYSKLISILKSGYPDTRTIHATPNTITLGVISDGGSTIFRLQQNLDLLIVSWDVDNTLFGKHYLRWEFPQFMDQDLMVEKMTKDINEYQLKLFS